MIKILPAILLLALAACSSSNITTEWSCPVNQPDGCNSTADGDAIALGLLSDSSNPPPIVERTTPAAITPESEALKEAVDAVSGQRTNEEVTAIWVGSFIDGGGNYHPASELYIVLRPSEWRLP